MSRTLREDEPLFVRHPSNPILDAASWSYPMNTAFNPGATLLEDGTTLLLCRVEDLRGHSHLTAARSKNGVDGWEVDPQPTLPPQPDLYPEELWGVEDSRITFIPELGQYAVLFTSYGKSGPGVSLAFTRDFKIFERKGQVMPPEDKDAALFPRRFNGRWVMIHRPVNPAIRGAHMWISYSEDLVHWTDRKVMLEAREGAWWDANKIGLCCPPIETERGWLTLYHGVKMTGAGCLYRVGLALFDLENPEKCIRRGQSWVMGPKEPYERFGDVGYVVFPCGFTLDPKDNDTLRIYYGAADSSISLATGSVHTILDWLDQFGK